MKNHRLGRTSWCGVTYGHRADIFHIIHASVPCDDITRQKMYNPILKWKSDYLSPGIAWIAFETESHRLLFTLHLRIKQQQGSGILPLPHSGLQLGGKSSGSFTPLVTRMSRMRLHLQRHANHVTIAMQLICKLLRCNQESNVLCNVFVN